MSVMQNLQTLPYMRTIDSQYTQKQQHRNVGTTQKHVKEISHEAWYDQSAFIPKIMG